MMVGLAGQRVLLFSLGWALVGLASLRARVLPPAVSIAITLGGLLGFKAATPPWGVALGLAVATAGAWLVRQDRTVRRNQIDLDPRPIATAQL